MSDDYEVKVTTGTSSVTVTDEEPTEEREAEGDDSTVYLLAPIDAPLGFCRSCGCRLQHPGPWDGEKGSIWLTPWMDCGGQCTVCKAHEEDPVALAEMKHWLLLTDPEKP